MIAIPLLGGAATYLVAHVAFRLRNIHTLNRQRLLCAALLFALFALGHLLRLLSQMQVTVGPQTIPLWISAPLALIAALLSFWMWKLSK